MINFSLTSLEIQFKSLLRKTHIKYVILILDFFTHI